MSTKLDCDLYLAQWQEFVSQGTIQPSVSPLVAASWQRCRSRLNPLQVVKLKSLAPDHLLAAQVACFDLISVARPIMEDIYQYVENTDTMVTLINPAGYVLDLLGDNEALDFARQHGIVVGVLLAESQVGTNAFALSLVERTPARVNGAEHYLQQFHDLSASAAPIFEMTGRPLGALGLLTPAYCHQTHTLGLAVAGARAVENQRQSDQLLKEQNSQLAELNAILASISDGILVWNAEGVLMHVNTAALKIIEIPYQKIVGRRVRDIFTLPPSVEEALIRREPLHDVEATLQIGERTTTCVLSLQFAYNKDELRWIIATLRRERDVLRLVHRQVGTQASSTMEDLLGESGEMHLVRSMAAAAAMTDSCVLIRGESGTGKNIVASAIHNASRRKDEPFLLFAASSVPTDLQVSELLGYEEGIPGKLSGGRPSKFELAHGGTLFFQDVDALSLEAQGLLLNLLEMGSIERLGSGRPIPVDVRILAATPTNIEKLIVQGSFRADLYYRLSTVEITLPPLRAHARDIPLLVERNLARLARQFNHPFGLAEGVMDRLKQYSWPGNVRELETVLARAAVHAGASEIIGPMHLAEFIHSPARWGSDSTQPYQPAYQSEIPSHSLYEIEREAFLQAARLCNGNVSKMVQVLGISRTTVWRRLKEFHVHPEDFRQAK